MLKTLIFYTKDECELCDRADEVIASVAEAVDWQVSKVDITKDAGLLDTYAWSIPVLKRADNDTELGWPFSPSQFRRFIQES